MNSKKQIGFLPPKEEAEVKEKALSPHEQMLMDCFTETFAKYAPCNSIKTATLILSTQEVIDRMQRGAPNDVYNILVGCGYEQYTSGHAALWLFEDK